ncbi:hypothetical protein C5C31_02880 [Rathayibacter rathayi]|uniref:Uncharacterized protein n=1 Tax=Rathayibacter rathayi TaxID=33887 RepID=A0ABD6WBY6_RATRA|nr:hypothetical protein [Rathayibacter rathayi]AZZ47900.1 hypothetical protein C1O28_00755 [Rathayibacter rathayi]MWV75172.1 hypothetical protein [Rathayibacter rathayi NCPPB 2980 = VKM Ac-1601]PPF15548.1 hypothetical protein C5C04_03155 [Rathayibacter rathayi]PPF26032.1 hypothetical protein C5C34_00905 [Rathayibacter rathayi]PPF51310.1 hypothetical protein C5C08_02645 [Rathayibacter rathayi]
MSGSEKAGTAAERRRRLWLMVPILFVGVLIGRAVATAVGVEDPWNVVVTAAVAAVLTFVILVLVDTPR